MDLTDARPSLQAETAARLRAFPALRASYRRAAAAGPGPTSDAFGELDEHGEVRQRPKAPGRELGGVEERTESFRVELARGHVARVREVTLKAAVALEEWTDVVAGEAEALLCKNWKWRTGAKKPARRDERCTSSRLLAGERHRCALRHGHEGEHEVDRTRVPARDLLRECSGTVRVHRVIKGRRGGRLMGQGRLLQADRVVVTERPCLRLHGHKGKCKAMRPPKWDRACPCALCTMHESVSTIEWHEGRERGQRARFETVRRCGSRIMTAACGVCGKDRKPVPEGCGVRRVCDKCDAFGAMRRRSRFGRARARAFIAGHRYGLARRIRRGGRYTEKMLTVTVPHALLEDAGGIVKEKARDTLHARVIALFEAWPRFLRKVNRHWLERRAGHVTYHRAFEWTPGRSDEHGHPHFHVYVWSPWVDAALLQAYWAEALREVGWPVGEDANGRPKVRTKLQMLRSFNVRAARELMKGGRRQALTLSRLEFVDPAAGAEFARGAPRAGQLIGPGVDAFKYAEGWTLGDVKECSDDVRARLYMALEGRRLTQASRAFFLEDEPAKCECCGASFFRVRFDAVEPAKPSPATSVHSPRGPPDVDARDSSLGAVNRLARRVLGGALFSLRAPAVGGARGARAGAFVSRRGERLLS